MVQSRLKFFVQIPVIIIMYSLSVGCALALLQSTISNDHVNSRQLVNLAEKWNLTDDGVEFGGREFRLDYIVSDFILDSMVSGEVYTIECKDEGVIVPESDLNFTIITDDTPPGAGEFERTVSVTVTARKEDLEKSIIYNEFYDGDTVVAAQLQFCFRLSLYTSGASPIEVNFLETLIGIKFDLTAGFSIDTINVKPRDAQVTNVTQNYDVDVYHCDDSDVELTGTALANSYNQGEILRICITPNQMARDQSVYMKAIDSFTYRRDYGGPLGEVAQEAVTNSQEASNYLTDLSCTPGSIVCTIETLLVAAMFVSPGVVQGSGTAMLQIGSDPDRMRRRNAEWLSSHRSLQEGDDRLGAASEFDLNFPVTLGERYNGILKTSSSSATKLLFPFLAMATMMTSNLIIL